MTDQSRGPAHLVERVTERLLRTGALEESAANLLGGVSRAGTRDSVPAGPASSAPLPVPPVGLAEQLSPPLSNGLHAALPAHPDAVPVVSTPTMVGAAALAQAGMVDASRARTRMLEEFRLLQREIMQAAFGPDAKPGFSNLLMVTSARPGEGKSFTSINLAGSIARQADHSVMLIDADSKHDSFCRALGLEDARGLLDLVADPELDAAPLIVKTPIRRLSILPIGQQRDRSSELFSSKDMIRLVQNVGRRYADRLVIFDAPPCLSTSDPAVLAPIVGQILFIVEANRTQRDEVEAALDLIQACPTITLVLNKQQSSSRYAFGTYSSSYYAP